MDRTVTSFRSQGVEALQRGQIDTAIDLLFRAVKADGQDAEARAALGTAFSRKGLHVQARHALQSALDLKPDHARYLSELGAALEAAGDTDGAAEAYRAALLHDPGIVQARKGLQAMQLPLPPTADRERRLEIACRARPKRSRAALEQDTHGLRLDLPPVGLLFQTGGPVGLLLCGAALIAILVVASLTQSGDIRGSEIWTAWGFVSLFSSGALAGALWDIQAGLRRATIAVSDGRLRTRQEGPLGCREREWSAHQLRGISVGPGWLAKNRRPIPELKILASDGRAAFLAGRDEAELKWIAALLEAALDLPPRRTGQVSR